MSMEERIRQHIDHLFASAPSDSRVTDIKNEILLNTQDRYHDLLSQGKGEEEAFAAAISSIGDIGELIQSLGIEMPDSRTNRAELSPPPPPAAKIRGKGRRKLLREAIDNIVWMAALTVYFLISFDTSAWHITWLMFLITPALINIIHAVLDYQGNGKPDTLYILDKNTRSIKNNVVGALWMVIVALYFVISFASRAWHITWVAFFIGSALQSLITIIFMMTSKSNKQG